jgi:hypothetical protein
MDYHDHNHDHYVDLADIPSDAFDLDELDLDRPRSVADYSSWPAESSPAPLEAGDEDEGEEMEEADYSEHEVGEDYDQDLEEDEIEEDSEDQEEEDQETGDEDDEYDAEEADLLEALMEEDHPELEAGNFMDQDHWDSEADLEEVSDHQQSPILRADHQFAGLLAEMQARRDRDRQSEAPSDALFVDQGHDLLPPIETILSSVRRSHARAVDLLHMQRGQSLRPPAQDRSLLGPFGRGSAGPSRENQRHNHRHHPYGMPQDNLRARMDRDNSRARDELVAVEMRPLRAAMRRNRTPPRSQPEVIDLTGEPDSPGEPSVIVAPRPRAPNALQNPGRNPRRRLSLNHRTPSLARSDSSILGNDQNVIDLTLDDSPAPPLLPQQLPRRNHHNHNHNHNHANPNPHLHRHQPHHHHHHRRAPGMSRMPYISLEDQEVLGPSIGARLADFVIQRLGFGRPHDVEVQVIGGAGLNMDNPIAGNIPNLNYGNNAAGAAAPKRDHVPPPKAREGFTRDTGNEDDVVVCPSCEKELKYDPDAANDTAMSPPRPTKKPRSKKDQEEHHFWALKDCGHVSF